MLYSSYAKLASGADLSVGVVSKNTACRKCVCGAAVAFVAQLLQKLLALKFTLLFSVPPVCKGPNSLIQAETHQLGLD